jgi:hypothetical protein
LQGVGTDRSHAGAEQFGQLSQTEVEHRTAEVNGGHFGVYKALKDFSRAGKRSGAQIENPEPRPPLDGGEQTRTPTHIEAQAQNMIDSIVGGGKPRKMIGKRRRHMKILDHL